MEREYKTGQHVIYVDSYGVAHDALVTIWWYGNALIKDYLSQYGFPGCNVLYVVSDEKKTDTYGRQTEHSTSVIHKTKQPAHGSYWCFPDEL